MDTKIPWQEVKLIQFTVRNFRSIKEAYKIPVSETTVLVGKNNEGKSNLLQALSMAMDAIAYQKEHRLRFRGAWSSRRRRYLGYDRESNYDWERDFPISFQDEPGKKKTTFSLKFKFTDDELESFRKEIGSRLNGELDLEITIGRKRELTVGIKKRGRGSQELNKKSKKIASYIADRISFNYIPTIRTDREAHDIIDDLLRKKLSELRRNEDYEKALEAIKQLEKPVFEKLSSEVKKMLSEFLPRIKDVSITEEDDADAAYYRRRSMHSQGDFNVIVDDGVPTNIEHKGDGVKSLATIALLKAQGREDVSIIAIEEPESHLHPEAIHQLRKIIHTLEGKNQIVLTTHNPLFVNRNSISSNIIVDGKRAKEAKNLEDIRKVLGVRVSDNLKSAECILLVEGSTEKNILPILLSKLSPKIKKALNSNKIAIQSLDGCGNLSHRLYSLDGHISRYFVLLDDDRSAREALDSVKKKNSLLGENYAQTCCKGMKDAEFEDCLNPNCYKKAVKEKYEISLDCAEFKNSKGKWSSRMKAAFRKGGKNFNDAIKFDVKDIIVDCVKNNPTLEEVLCPKEKADLNSILVEKLEKLIDGK